MKKIKLLSLLTLLTFSSLVGCGNPNSSSENEQISSSENSSEVSSDIKDDYKLTIVSPSGAPAIAIADLAYNYKEQYNFELNKEATILQQSFLGNELDVKYYAWNEETLAYDIRKLKLEDGVEMVRIVGNGHMIKLLKYSDGKVGLVLGHKVKKCKTQKEMIEVILHYAIDELGFMDKLLLSVFC